MDGATVIQAFTENEIAVEHEGAPFLMWIESTTGLARNQELAPNVVFVAGTETIRVPDRGSISVTVLQAVSDRKLESSIEDVLLYKTWKSGKYTIDAKMIKNDGVNVTLEKRDCTTIDVPISRLDSASQTQANQK